MIQFPAYSQIHNYGPGTVGGLTVTIAWPSALEDGWPLLYLPEAPRVSGGAKGSQGQTTGSRGEVVGSCQADDVNPFNLTVRGISWRIRI